MTNTDTVVSTQEAWERIQAAGEEEPGNRRANFEGETIEGLDLSDKDIRANLNLKNTHILGHLLLCRSTFSGNFIDLDGARVEGDIFLNGMEPKDSEGYSLYLRQTSVKGTVEVEHTKINFLCIGGLQFDSIVKQVRTCGTRINRGISLDPGYEE